MTTQPSPGPAEYAGLLILITGLIVTVWYTLIAIAAAGRIIRRRRHIRRFRRRLDRIVSLTGLQAAMGRAQHAEAEQEDDW